MRPTDRQTIQVKEINKLERKRKQTNLKTDTLKSFLFVE